MIAVSCFIAAMAILLGMAVIAYLDDKKALAFEIAGAQVIILFVTAVVLASGA